MKIVFHAVAARKGKEGGATHLLAETIRGLAEVAPQHEYVYCLDESLAFDMPDSVRRIDVSLGGARERLKWDQIDYPRILREERADLAVAALGIAALRPGVPQVTMHPDSTYFCPHAKFDRGVKARAGIAARRELMRMGVRASRMAIVPSDSMADGLTATFGTATPVRVLRYGWEREAQPPHGGGGDGNEDGDGGRARILYVSHLQRHKAHIHLVPLASELKHLGAKFEITVCVTRDDDPELFERFTSMINESGLADEFNVMDRVSPEQVNQLYGDADCFVYPSLCESFGFAMAEAVSAGVPVVAAATPINREILGPAALYFPPMSPEFGAIAIKGILDRSVDGEALVRAGQEHQRQIFFSWNEYSRRLIRLLEEAAGDRESWRRT